MIDNKRIFETEDIDRVQEIYEDMTESFNGRGIKYDNTRYAKLFKSLWGNDNWREYFYSIYGDDFEEFKKDYEFELNEFIDNEHVKI
jgi:uncharacterized protein YeaO (DUF488 family)